jgi:hypothetical protein
MLELEKLIRIGPTMSKTFASTVHRAGWSYSRSFRGAIATNSGLNLNPRSAIPWSRLKSIGVPFRRALL